MDLLQDINFAKSQTTYLCTLGQTSSGVSIDFSVLVLLRRSADTSLAEILVSYLTNNKREKRKTSGIHASSFNPQQSSYVMNMKKVAS